MLLAFVSIYLFGTKAESFTNLYKMLLGWIEKQQDDERLHKDSRKKEFYASCKRVV